VITIVTADVDARAGLLLALACLACCGWGDRRHAAPRAEQAASSGASIEQRVSALKTEFPDAAVQLDASGSRVMRIQQLRPKIASARNDDATEAARDILRQRVVAAVLGVSSDLRELCAPVSRKDPQIADYAIVRMQQCVNGVKVIGAELVMSVRLKPSPAIDLLTSSLAPAVPDSVTPKISAAEASKTATAAVSTKSGAASGAAASGAESGRIPPAPELVIFQPQVFQLEGLPRLCWLIRRDAYAIFVDAATGAVVHQYAEAQRGSIR
jgi:hypothetical protein